MLYKWRSLLICLLIGLCQSALAAPGTLLFVPLDDRPVCLDNTVETIAAAGWDVKVPPRELIAGATKQGDPDALLKWLEEEGQTSTAIVASSDALIYGGLVSSRTHNFSQETLAERVDRVLALQEKLHHQDVYLFSTIMRSPKASSAPVEPAYFEQWGPDIFRLGALEDKKELNKISSMEKRELAQLQKKIPVAVLQDLNARRAKNFKVNELLLQGMRNAKFNYMLLGRDDTSTYSQAHKEARILGAEVQRLPKGKVSFFAGADQLGLILLVRSMVSLERLMPFFYPLYPEGAAEKTIPTYEDEPIGDSYEKHVLALGGYPVNRLEKADFIVAMNTPRDGKCYEASNVKKNNGKLDRATKDFLKDVRHYVGQGYSVILADVKYGNGADNSLVPELFKQKLAYKLAAYGGWNTAGNSLGMALGQGTLFFHIPQSEHEYLLDERYLDDWAYEANARQKVYKDLIWPQGWPNKGLQGTQLQTVEQAVRENILKVAEPYMGTRIQKYKYTLPWQRMFEVQVKK